MTTVKSIYNGEFRTTSEHVRSGALIATDAPIDNHGLGQNFSPTDLVATALASCMMTVMGIKAEDKGLSLSGMRCDVLKVMQDAPRRIARLEVTVYMPGHLDTRQRKLLEKTALTCPVAKSLALELEQVVHFHYVD